jgi:hypothetical protein
MDIFVNRALQAATNQLCSFQLKEDVMKLTFKKEPRATGLFRASEPDPSTSIKADGKKVGYIKPPNWWERDERKWKISLAVKDSGRSGFKWTRLLARFDSEPNARAFVREHWATIEFQFALHQFED